MILIGIGIALAVVVTGLVAYLYAGYVVNPDVVHFAHVSEMPQAILLEGGTFAGSAMWYSGYSATYQDGVLTVTIRARSVPLPGSMDDPFTVSIPNTYGSVREVRVSGGDGFTDKVIWTASK